MRALLVLLAGCGIADLQPGPPAPRSVDEAFDAYPGGGQADDVALLANGDIVIVGCESGGVVFDAGATVESPSFNGSRSTFVTRLDRTTRKAVWTRRSSSPCGVGDNWTVPRVAVSSTGTIWVAAHGWGRGAHVSQTEARELPTVLLAFDDTGGLGAQRDLGAGLRVRAMTALDAGRIAIAGQSAIEQVRSTAFVAAIDASAAEVWRTTLPHAHLSLVESLAADGARVIVGGETDSTIDGLGRGREGVGFATTLNALTGAVVASWSRHYAGVNMDDVRVAIVDGAAYVAYGVSQRVGNPWPLCGPARAGDCLPPIPPDAFSAILVEPLAATPAWRRVFSGSTHTSVGGIAVTQGRLAVVIDAQYGAIDLGRGAWTSTFSNLGAYVELDSSDGITLDARKLVAHGEYSRIFLRRVIWDGAAFTAVGHARGTSATLIATYPLRDDAPFVWRVGTRAATDHR